jgi:hypothetical protein
MLPRGAGSNQPPVLCTGVPVPRKAGSRREHGRPVAITRISAIELLDAAGNVERDVAALFRVSGTAIVAADPRAVVALGGAPPGSVRLRVAAADRAGFVRSNRIEVKVR